MLTKEATIGLDVRLPELTWDPPESQIFHNEQVSDTEPLTIRLVTHTEDYDVRWRLKLHWWQLGNRGVVTIPETGSFRTYATKDPPAYEFQPDGGYQRLN